MTHAFPLRWLQALALALLLLVPALGQDRVPVRFERAAGTAWGESLYLVGDLPELGADDAARALRMVPGPGGTWSLTVALPAGAAYHYRYVVRRNDPGLLQHPGNARAVSPRLDGTAPGAARERQVTVRYLSGLNVPRLRYVRAPGRVEEAVMRRVGPGRGPGESLWEATVWTALAELEHGFHDGQGRIDMAPGGGSYRTGYAAFLVRDGQVHPEQPAGDDRAGQVHRLRWWSNGLGNERELRVYLPRGYDRHPGRRYPVLYVQDGQNLFQHEGPHGGWELDRTLDRLIAAGRIPELIVVGVGNTRDRMQEYMPPEDGGWADRYAAFLVHELKPWVDANLRTLTGPEHTGIMGSSLGGISALYVAWERPDVFGRAASLSGSFWLQGFLTRRVAVEPRPALRVWLDSGSAGHTADSLEGTMLARDLLLGRGFVLGADLAHRIEPGAGHDELAWRARCGEALEFLFPAR